MPLNMPSRWNLNALDNPYPLGSCREARQHEIDCIVDTTDAATSSISAYCFVPRTRSRKSIPTIPKKKSLRSPKSRRMKRNTTPDITSTVSESTTNLLSLAAAVKEMKRHTVNTLSLIPPVSSFSSPPPSVMGSPLSPKASCKGFGKAAPQQHTFAARIIKAKILGGMAAIAASEMSPPMSVARHKVDPDAISVRVVEKPRKGVAPLDEKKKRAAVVIGVAETVDVRMPCSKGIERDVEQVANALHSIGFRVLLYHTGLESRLPTKVNILDGIREAAVGVDTVLVFYQGLTHVGHLQQQLCSYNEEVDTYLFTQDTLLGPNMTAEENYLTLRDLQGTGSNLVYVDATSIMQGCLGSSLVHGVAHADCPKSIGGRINGRYELAHRHLMSYYFVKGCQGSALRDRVLTPNSLNVYLAKKLKARGIEVSTNSSSLKIGDLVLADKTDYGTRCDKTTCSNRKLIAKDVKAWVKITFRVDRRNHDATLTGFTSNLLKQLDRVAKARLPLTKRKMSSRRGSKMGLEVNKATISDFGVGLLSIVADAVLYVVLQGDPWVDAVSSTDRLPRQYEFESMIRDLASNPPRPNVVMTLQQGKLVALISAHSEDNAFEIKQGLKRGKPVSGGFIVVDILEHITVSLSTTDYCAHKIDRACRSGELSQFGEIAFFGCGVSPVDCNYERDIAALFIQAFSTGCKTRKKFKPRMALALEDLQSRYHVTQEEEGCLKDIALDMYNDKILMLVNEEDTLRWDKITWEREERSDIHSRVSRVLFAAEDRVRACNASQEHLEFKEALLRWHVEATRLVGLKHLRQHHRLVTTFHTSRDKIERQEVAGFSALKSTIL
eukprot:TRINITY_DN4364_c0_g1_i2.p1 TRINITY_DN4364_c0_g1~~TRINITY_DN4364_c0_g1_i2.p1  ORF type:complete len:837 (+),score=166.08 TRINITY_DN4364_c0_g1_i2:71-2581(+)